MSKSKGTNRNSSFLKSIEGAGNTMKKRMWSFVAMVCIVTIAQAQRPNVVVFLVDDMGIMDTSVPFLTDEAGRPKRYPLNDWYRTPSMRRLADQGIRFNNFYAQTVCSPTRASIMTGQNATRHGTTTWINSTGNNRGTYGPPEWNWVGITSDDTTLPRVLSANGYRTIHVGKAHFGPLKASASDPTNIGFDVNIAGTTWGHPKSYYGEDHYGNHPKYTEGGKRLFNNVPHLEKYHGTGTFLTEALTQEANHQLAAAVSERTPFFLHMSHYAVHAPFHPDPRFAEQYQEASKKPYARAFATLVASMDKSLGDILDQLESLGVAEDTLVIFLGDNGSDAPLGSTYDHTSAAPLRGKKGTCYEGGMRVPFIAAWAKPNPENPWQKKLPIPHGAIQSQLGTVMDIFPTVLALVGVEHPTSHVVDGVDLATQLSGKNNPERPEVFLMHFPHGHNSSYFTSYRSKDWKVVYDYNPQGTDAPKHKLFNLKEDPFENENLAIKRPEKLAQMIRAMAEQLEAEGARYPIDANGAELKPKHP